MAAVKIEDALYHAVTMCLPSAWQVRMSWPSEDMPGWKREEDVCFLRIVPFGDGFTGLCETGDGGVRTFVRGHEAQFVLYGPGAYEGAEAIRMRMLSTDIRRFLWVEYGVVPLAHIAAPKRLDEWFSGAWWHRYDVTLRFYESAAEDGAGEPPIACGPDIRLIGG